MIMALKEGDFVEIEYVGRIKESGEIFDLTDEKLAREKNILNPRVRYGPVVVIVGAGYVLRGLDAALRELSTGEKKTIAVEPAAAFGDRDAAMTKTFSLTEFKRQGIDPAVGQTITLQNNITGRVLSVSGGRVMVDFNHPLAGKALEYAIKVNRLLATKEEKIAAIFEFYAGGSKEMEAKVDGSRANVLFKVPRNVTVLAKKRVADDVMKWISGINEVSFVESYKKVAPQKAEEEKKAATKEEKAKTK